MELTRAQERALRAAQQGRLMMSGTDVWIAHNVPGSRESVTLETIDAIDWEGLIWVDSDAVLAAGVMRGPAHRPMITAAGLLALCQQDWGI